jgi:uncharacterized protein (DUF2141 family)
MIKLFFLIYTFSFLQNENNKLTIEIEGNDNKKGNFHIALYTKNEKFPSVDNTYKNLIQVANNSIVVFQNLPKNEYAFAIYHDENKNGKLDKNIFGVPTEKYAFSNNARGTFSSPSFSSASFSLNQDRKFKIYLK